MVSKALAPLGQLLDGSSFVRLNMPKEDSFSWAVIQWTFVHCTISLKLQCSLHFAFFQSNLVPACIVEQMGFPPPLHNVLA